MVTDYTKEYEALSREDLEKEDARLAKQRTEVRERQLAVTGLLDAHRALEQLSLPPESVKKLYRLSQIRAEGETEAEEK